MRIFDVLPRLPVILFSFVAMMIIGASIGYFQKFVGGELLDMSMNGSDALVRLTDMTASEKTSHTWITLIPDSLYPLAYGSFFAGATLKLAGQKKVWLVLPALVTVAADFCENIVQILALNGFEGLIMAKSILTPVKFSALTVMSILFLGLALLTIARLIKQKSQTVK